VSSYQMILPHATDYKDLHADVHIPLLTAEA